jgi:hypothetical protein
LSKSINKAIATGILGVNALSGVSAFSPAQEALDAQKEQGIVREAPKGLEYPALTHGPTQDDQLEAAYEKDLEDKKQKREDELSAAELAANSPKASGSGSPPPSDDPPDDFQDKATELPYMRSENGLPGRTIPQDEYDRRQAIIDKHVVPRPNNTEVAQSLRQDSPSFSYQAHGESSENPRTGEHTY